MQEIEQTKSEVQMANDALIDSQMELDKLQQTTEEEAHLLAQLQAKRVASVAALKRDTQALLRAGHEAMRVDEHEAAKAKANTDTALTEVATIQSACTDLSTQISDLRSTAANELATLNATRTAEADATTLTTTTLETRLTTATNERNETGEALFNIEDSLKVDLKRTTDFLMYLNVSEEKKPAVKRGKKKSPSTVEGFSAEEIEGFRSEIAPPAKLASLQATLEELTALYDEAELQQMVISAQVERESTHLTCCEEEHTAAKERAERLRLAAATNTEDAVAAIQAQVTAKAEENAAHTTAAEAEITALEAETAVLQAELTELEAKAAPGEVAVEEEMADFAAQEQAAAEDREKNMAMCEEVRSSCAERTEAATERVNALKTTLTELKESIAAVAEELESSDEASEEAPKPKPKKGKKAGKASPKKAAKAPVSDSGSSSSSSAPVEKPKPKRGKKASPKRASPKKGGKRKRDETSEEEEEVKPKGKRGRGGKR